MLTPPLSSMASSIIYGAGPVCKSRHSPAPCYLDGRPGPKPSFHGIHQRTDALDGGLDLVTLAQPAGRGHEHAHPARRARRNDVARFEGEGGADVFDQERDVEDQVVRVRLLADLAVDFE